jgi:hypothetical protein
MRMTAPWLILLAMAGCDAPPAQNPMEEDFSDLEQILSEIEWSVEDEVLPEQPKTVVLPITFNREHVLRIGRQCTGYILYWDGSTWVETEIQVTIPEGWYFGDLKCQGDEVWDDIDALVPMYQMPEEETTADETPDTP